MIYPWQMAQWQTLWQAKQESRLPHAILLSGLAGLGKTEFAYHFAHALLCQQVGWDGVACNACHACRLIIGKVHPNVLWVEPEEPGQAIKVDQIRSANEFASQSSLQGEYRLVIINPADNMNTNAANALLKTLEEPSKGALIVLIGQQSKRLPATVLSRCQKIIFSPPNSDEALQWLQTQRHDAAVDLELMLSLADGAPLKALQFIHDDKLPVRQDLFATLFSLSQKQGDPVKLAAKLPDNDVVKLIDYSLSFVMDVVRLQMGVGNKDIVNKDHEQQLLTLKQNTHLQNNVKLMEYLQRLRAPLCQGLNINKQLVIENMLIQWRGK